MNKIVILFLIFAGGAFAQMAKVAPENADKEAIQQGTGQIPREASGQAWQIPFASSDNTISLDIQNNSNIEADNVLVTFKNIPSWLTFKSSTASIKSITANASGDAEFTFSIDRKAPVGKDTTLTATISTANGQTWTKDIEITVGAPKDYKLYNNFPNPFNPSTKIAFDLPKASHVKLIIYDIIGREVAQIADADYPAGYTELTWNGVNKNGVTVSSGVYFYRASTDSWDKVKKMLMLK